MPRNRSRLTAALAALLSAALLASCTDEDPVTAPESTVTAAEEVASDPPDAPTVAEEPTEGAPTVSAEPTASATPTDELPPEPAATPTEAEELPADELVPLVPGPADVPVGMQLVGNGFSGPQGATEISSLSSDPEAAHHFLEDNGFEKGYSAQYGDAEGALITAVVARFSSPAGATAYFKREVAEAREEATQVPVTGLGDEAAQSRRTIPEGDVDEEVAIRFRRGDTWWVVSSAAPGKVDEQLVRRLAELLLQRAG